MKKFTILLGLLSISCLPPSKRYEVTMEINYPNKIDTITVINESKFYPELRSYRGTNYVTDFYETSTPIKIVSIKEVN